MHDFADQQAANNNTAASFKNVVALEQAAISNHDLELELEAHIIKDYVIYRRIADSTKNRLKQAAEDLKSTIATAGQKGLKIVTVKAYHLLGLIYTVSKISRAPLILISKWMICWMVFRKMNSRAN